MKIFNKFSRVLLALLFISPVLGTLGVFPAPTAEMYNTESAFNFINVLMETKYINIIMMIVFLICLVLTIMNRMALVALLILPITVNIVAFHLVLDGGLFTAGAIMGNILALINIYFLWINKDKYKPLVEKSA